MRQKTSLCEVELQKQIKHFRKLVWAVLASIWLQLANFLPYLPDEEFSKIAPLYDIIYWLHLSLLYYVGWSFAMMFFFPCNLYY